jgi:hypothetical protein
MLTPTGRGNLISGIASMLICSIRARVTLGITPYEHSGFRPTQSLLPDISGIIMATTPIVTKSIRWGRRDP